MSNSSAHITQPHFAIVAQTVITTSGMRVIAYRPAAHTYSHMCTPLNFHRYRERVKGSSNARAYSTKVMGKRTLAMIDKYSRKSARRRGCGRPTLEHAHSYVREERCDKCLMHTRARLVPALPVRRNALVVRTERDRRALTTKCRPSGVYTSPPPRTRPDATPPPRRAQETQKRELTVYICFKSRRSDSQHALLELAPLY